MLFLNWWGLWRCLSANWTKINVVDSRWRLRLWDDVLADLVSSDALDHVIFIRHRIRVDLLILEDQILAKREPIVIILVFQLLLAPEQGDLRLLRLDASLFVIEAHLILPLHHSVHLLHEHPRPIFLHTQSALNGQEHRLNSVVFFLDKSHLGRVVLPQSDHPQLDQLVHSAPNRLGQL